MRPLLLLLGWCCVVALNCSAQTRGPVRPVAKGAKLGPFGKDYVALPKAFSWSNTNVVGLVITEAIPAGVYRAKFEDDNGYYLPAPGRIAAKLAQSIYTHEGGLYVRRDKPDVFYLYTIPTGKNTGIPRGDMVRAHPRLPRDFAGQLRQ